jgi:hypothetical protein
MREYSKVSPKVWQSERFRNLPSDEARFLFLYLLTNTHQTSAGCYCLPPAYAAADLAWGVTRYQDTLATLTGAGMVHVDKASSEIFIDQWFAHNAAMHEDHRRGIESDIRTLKSEHLKTMALQSLAESWDADAPKREANRAARERRTARQKDNVHPLQQSLRRKLGDGHD